MYVQILDVAEITYIKKCAWIDLNKIKDFSCHEVLVFFDLHIFFQKEM